MTTWTPTRRTAIPHAARFPTPAARRDPLVQIGLIFGAALLYFGVRGVTEGAETAAIANGIDLLRFERWLGLNVEAAIQTWALNYDALVTFMNWVYIWGHWPAIGITLVWLHRTNRVSYLHLRNAMFLSGAIGLVIFLLHPVAPPRLLGDAVIEAGLLTELPIDTVTERSGSYRLLQPPSLVNKYAALPSFHVGWNLLVGLALATSTRRRTLRAIGVVSPLAMACAVVITANHYLLDIVAGSAIALVAWFIVGNLSPRRRRPLDDPYWGRGIGSVSALQANSLRLRLCRRRFTRGDRPRGVGAFWLNDAKEKPSAGRTQSHQRRRWPNLREEGDIKTKEAQTQEVWAEITS